MRSQILATALVVGLMAGACGSDDNASGNDPSGESTRTVEIEMQDNKYVPDTVSVDAGESVRFVFMNNGEVNHDAYIGDEGAQADHEEEMNGEMGGHGMGESGAVTVKPGDSGELTYTFDGGDEVLIGCHEPGHYDGGMRLAIDVT